MDKLKGMLALAVGNLHLFTVSSLLDHEDEGTVIFRHDLI
jgi:hypothetical protein